MQKNSKQKNVIFFSGKDTMLIQKEQ